MSRIIFEKIKGYSPTDMILHADKPVSYFIISEVGKVVDRLMADEPLQYIFSSARFHGLDFKVTPAVLIPRPETEQLVDMIVDRYSRDTDLQVLDIATGSGCIAVALARSLRFPEVKAIDISSDALSIARENADALGVDIEFCQADATKLTPPVVPEFDIIVSNPPYITLAEEAEMPRNVLDYEPHQALFVHGSDPLLFYRAIASFAIDALKPGGTLWFEINPIFSRQMQQMLSAMSWIDVEISADERGKQRFALAVKQS